MAGILWKKMFSFRYIVSFRSQFRWRFCSVHNFFCLSSSFVACVGSESSSILNIVVPTAKWFAVHKNEDTEAKKKNEWKVPTDEELLRASTSIDLIICKNSMQKNGTDSFYIHYTYTFYSCLFLIMGRKGGTQRHHQKKKMKNMNCNYPSCQHRI